MPSTREKESLKDKKVTKAKKSERQIKRKIAYAGAVMRARAGGSVIRPTDKSLKDDGAKR